MRTSALFGAKSFGFYEIYGVSARTKGKGVNFSRFCADVFYVLYYTLLYFINF